MIRRSYVYINFRTTSSKRGSGTRHSLLHAAKDTTQKIIFSPCWLAVVSELVEVAFQGKDLSRSCGSDLVPHTLHVLCASSSCLDLSQARYADSAVK